MKTHVNTLLLALLLPLAATAGPPQDPQDQARLRAEPRTLAEIEAERPRAIVTVDCERAQWPSLQEVAAYQGLSAFDPVAHVRKRIVIAGARACRSGADQVLVVFQAQERPLALARNDR
jgi:hypothetical protein